MSPLVRTIGKGFYFILFLNSKIPILLAKRVVKEFNYKIRNQMFNFSLKSYNGNMQLTIHKHRRENNIIHS